MEPEIRPESQPVPPPAPSIMTPPPVAPTPEAKGSMGAIIGIVIIVIVIVAGAFYVWSSNGSQTLTEEELHNASLEAQENTEAQIEAIQSVNTSTEVTDIEADINNTDLGAVLNDLGNLDAEVQ